jgi:integrase
LNAASTHRQALSALLFLYSKVLQVQLPWMSELGRPRVQRRLPVVLSQDEVGAVFREREGVHRLFAQLLYGTGMRLTEGLQLRVKDVDFEHRAIVVRGQGRKGPRVDVAAVSGAGAARTARAGSIALGGRPGTG